MEKVTIKRVFISDKKKDGTPFKSRNGNKFWKIGIQCDQTEGAWASDLMFRNDDPRFNWEVGTQAEIKLWQNEKGYWNFNLPKPEDRIGELEIRVKALEDFMLNKSEEKNETPF